MDGAAQIAQLGFDVVGVETPGPLLPVRTLTNLLQACDIAVRIGTRQRPFVTTAPDLRPDVAIVVVEIVIGFHAPIIVLIGPDIGGLVIGCTATIFAAVIVLAIILAVAILRAGDGI